MVIKDFRWEIIFGGGPNTSTSHELLEPTNRWLLRFWDGQRKNFEGLKKISFQQVIKLWQGHGTRPNTLPKATNGCGDNYPLCKNNVFGCARDTHSLLMSEEKYWWHSCLSKLSGNMMRFWYAECRLPRNLAGFEPVTICFQHRFKMPRELWGGGGGGFRVKNHCVGLWPAPPRAEGRVTPASYLVIMLCMYVV